MISFRDEITRHQLLLMRLIGTQAKVTKEYLKKSESIIVDAIKKQDFKNLQQKLEKELRLMPAQALKLVADLAEYENQFVVKSVNKRVETPIEPLNNEQINEVVQQAVVNTSLNKTPLAIGATYKKFVDNKVSQYMQIVQDNITADTDEEDFINDIEERTDGMFTTQNNVLAGLSLLSVVSDVRSSLASESDIQVEWVLDAELNNCEDCVNMALNGPYDPDEVSADVPLHSNCGCFLVPILDELE